MSYLYRPHSAVCCCCMQIAISNQSCQQSTACNSSNHCYVVDVLRGKYRNLQEGQKLPFQTSCAMFVRPAVLPRNYGGYRFKMTWSKEDHFVLHIIYPSISIFRLRGWSVPTLSHWQRHAVLNKGAYICRVGQFQPGLTYWHQSSHIQTMSSEAFPGCWCWESKSLW